MDWRESYKAKLTTADEAVKHIKSGDRVTVTYTGILSEIESFTGEIISIEKVKQ